MTHLQLPIPACHDCTTCTDQLHACLSCVYIGCFAGSHRHAQAHAHSNATHMFSVEFLHGQLYCAACQDFVYDLEFEDALGTQKRVVGELLSQVNGRMVQVCAIVCAPCVRVTLFVSTWLRQTRF